MSSTRLSVPVPIAIPSRTQSIVPDAYSVSTSTGDASSISPRSVRFDERCVLIPVCTTKLALPQPRMGTLDLPIPIGLPWRRPSTSPTKERGAVSGDLGTPRSNDVKNVVLKVPFPIFRRKSYSSLQQPPSCPLPPCLVHRHAPSSHAPSLSKSSSASSSSSSTQAATGQARVRAGSRPKRSASLPPSSPDKNVETVPLRPCCTQCLSVSETRFNLLPPLKEHTPFGSIKVQSPLHLHKNTFPAKKEVEEDWCAGMHFTKGALRLRRSAPAEHGAHGEHEGENLLGALVRVDEVDRKRSTSPPPSPSLSASTRGTKPLPTSLIVQNLDRVRVTKGEDEGSEEELFPLPSPKRSPGASPSASPADSATYLPSQVLTEPRKLEAAIRAKIASRERELATPATTGPAEPATLPIRLPRTKAQAAVFSHFHPHTDEIVYDPTLPDPDALLAESAILLNSPPDSSPLASCSPRLSSSPPVCAVEPLAFSPGSSVATVISTSPSSDATTMLTPRRAAGRRPSLTGIMRAGAGVLRGISMSTPSISASGYTSYAGGINV